MSNLKVVPISGDAPNDETRTAVGGLVDSIVRLRWHAVKDGKLPPASAYTDVVVAVTNDKRQWVCADKYDGYSKTFGESYCPLDSFRVYKWAYMPCAPAI